MGGSTILPHLLGCVAKEEVSDDGKGKEEVRTRLHLRGQRSVSHHSCPAVDYLVEDIEHLPTNDCLHTLTVQGLSPIGYSLQNTQHSGGVDSTSRPHDYHVITM